ncbi:hypothetical protein Tco_0701370 [Tanacetum coccineum]
MGCVYAACGTRSGSRCGWDGDLYGLSARGEATARELRRGVLGGISSGMWYHAHVGAESRLVVDRSRSGWIDVERERCGHYHGGISIGRGGLWSWRMPTRRTGGGPHIHSCRRVPLGLSTELLGTGTVARVDVVSGTFGASKKQRGEHGRTGHRTTLFVARWAGAVGAWTSLTSRVSARGRSGLSGTVRLADVGSDCEVVVVRRGAGCGVGATRLISIGGAVLLVERQEVRWHELAARVALRGEGGVAISSQLIHVHILTEKSTVLSSHARVGTGGGGRADWGGEGGWECGGSGVGWRSGGRCVRGEALRGVARAEWWVMASLAPPASLLWSRSRPKRWGWRWWRETWGVEGWGGGGGRSDGEAHEQSGYRDPGFVARYKVVDSTSGGWRGEWSPMMSGSWLGMSVCGWSGCLAVPRREGRRRLRGVGGAMWLVVWLCVGWDVSCRKWGWMRLVHGGGGCGEVWRCVEGVDGRWGMGVVYSVVGGVVWRLWDLRGAVVGPGGLGVGWALRRCGTSYGAWVCGVELSYPSLLSHRKRLPRVLAVEQSGSWLVGAPPPTNIPTTKQDFVLLLGGAGIRGHKGVVVCRYHWRGGHADAGGAWGDRRGSRSPCAGGGGCARGRGGVGSTVGQHGGVGRGRGDTRAWGPYARAGPRGGRWWAVGVLSRGVSSSGDASSEHDGLAGTGGAAGRARRSGQWRLRKNAGLRGLLGGGQCRGVAAATCVGVAVAGGL